MGFIVLVLWAGSVFLFSTLFKKYDWLSSANISSALGLIVTSIILNYLNTFLKNYKSKDKEKRYIRYNTFLGMNFNTWGIISASYAIVCLIYGVFQTGISNMRPLAYAIDILLIAVALFSVFLLLKKRK